MQVRFSCIEWWDGLKYIIDTVQPVYKFLRFADQDKRSNLCDVVMEYQNMKFLVGIVGLIGPWAI
jgi:hypothetical protein